MFQRLDELANTPGFDEAKASLEARVRTEGGGHFSMAERTAVKQSVAQYNNSALRPLARAFGAFARAPGPSSSASCSALYTHAVFGTPTRGSSGSSRPPLRASTRASS
jgi:hypothetical protein